MPPLLYLKQYPTLEEVERVDHEKICLYHRFLPSPGRNDMGREDITRRQWEEIMQREVEILTRVEQRLHEFGGFTAEISKKIGWRLDK